MEFSFALLALPQNLMQVVPRLGEGYTYAAAASCFVALLLYRSGLLLTFIIGVASGVTLLAAAQVLSGSMFPATCELK